MNELEFTLKLEEIPVILDGKEYTLRELTGQQRDAYMDDMNKRMRYVGGKAEGFTKFEGLQAGLLAKCLFDSEGKNVSEKTIQMYPSHVVQALFAKAQELSGLNESGAEEVKND